MLFLGAQPGPGSIHGGQWEAAVEGTQNFADYSDHGDLAQDTEEYSSQPARPETKWGVLGAVTAESVPMRRTVSKSSAGSFKVRPSKTTSSSSSRRPRVQTSLSAPSYTATSSPATTMPLYSMPGAHYSYYSSNSAMASAMSGMNPDQYLAMYGQGLHPASYGASDMTSYNTDLATSLSHHIHAQQHVDPACTQMTMDGFDHFDGLESLNGMDSIDGIDGMDSMVYEPSVAAISPQSWGSSSSRRSSPDHGEDTWSLPMAASPAESHDSPASSPFAVEAASSTGSSSSSNTATAATIQQNRSNSEGGESARDHPLYKSAVCQADGFYHCPWEGDENCNHKPEKLKCNYDKFVDSHLKPYRCKHSACENARFSSTACLLRHEREAHAMHGHGDKPYLCPHTGCDRAHPGFGFPRQWNLKDHMRRVHHDDGKQLERMAAVSVAAAAAAESTPVAVSSSQAVSKGRKRKKESTSATATSSSSSSSSSRKSSSSSKSGSSSIDAEARRQAEALAALEAAHKAAIEKKRSEFRRHKDALSSTVLNFTQPDDPAMLAHLQAAQEHFDALSRISSDMMASMQGPYTFPQQSG
ncbi:hypothetical protein SBRCBS47491_004184 [Sporothrix bragantina]|uniref:C2H2-type domain-containing protein n=1 Tax=Sporothrix bragantina TaxID=671064 RepID=A0ABP0BMI0_9PEZI